MVRKNLLFGGVKMVKRSQQAGYTMIEMMTVLIIIVILMGIGFMVYSKFIAQSKEGKLYSDLKEYGTAILAMYNDTGALAGLNQAQVPFPDSLSNPSVITNQSVATKWRGPYVKNPPTCPFDGCQYVVDYSTGSATGLGQIYMYFVRANGVPIESAIALAKQVNGSDRMDAGECTTNDISQVKSGAKKPCNVYLSNTTGGAGQTSDVYYVFITGRY